MWRMIDDGQAGLEPVQRSACKDAQSCGGQSATGFSYMCLGGLSVNRGLFNIQFLHQKRLKIICQIAYIYNLLLSGLLRSRSATCVSSKWFHFGSIQFCDCLDCRRWHDCRCANRRQAFQRSQSGLPRSRSDISL